MNEHRSNTDNPIDFPIDRAIEFVMKFYNISREDAVNLYWDEIEAYRSLAPKLNGIEE